jgi:hypothetical protein
MGEAGAGDPVSDPQAQKTHIGDALAGFGWTVLAHVFAFVLLYFSFSAGGESLSFFLLFGIGITQLLYVVPMVVHFRKKQEFGVAKGIVIAASVTFLLNSACWGWFLTAKPRIGG